MDEPRIARWLTAGSLLFVSLAACSFTAGTTAANIGNDAPTRDARPDATVADAAVTCTGSSLTCVDDVTLQTCDGPGMTAIDTTCGWGCTTAGGAHCGVLQPAGGAVADTLLGTGSQTSCYRAARRSARTTAASRACVAAAPPRRAASTSSNSTA